MAKNNKLDSTLKATIKFLKENQGLDQTAVEANRKQQQALGSYTPTQDDLDFVASLEALLPGTKIRIAPPGTRPGYGAKY